MEYFRFTYRWGHIIIKIEFYFAGQLPEVKIMKTYLRHQVLKVVDVKELFALEYLDFEGKYKNYSESHYFFELCYVEQGCVELLLTDERVELSEGEVILIQPGVRHTYASPSGNKSRAFVICFESSTCALRAISGMKFSSDVQLADNMKHIIEESKMTFRMNEKEQLEVLPCAVFGGQQAILLQLDYLLITLIRRTSLLENSNVVFLDGDNFYGELAEIIIRYFKNNLHERLSLEDISSRFNYSRSHLCKSFKEQTGEPLIVCFTKLKMEEAKRLLIESDLSVGEISSSLGYPESKYFCALFKKYAGATPGTYRRSFRMTNN